MIFLSKAPPLLPPQSAATSAMSRAANLPNVTMNSLINIASTPSHQLKQEESSRWTTPGLRPLAEAPYVAPGVFEKELPSEKRYQMLFPGDPEKRARMKDLDGELEALNQYLISVFNPDPNLQEGPGRRRFYDGLATELEQDYEELREEATKLYLEASVLGQFEYRYSDNGPAGGTTRLEEILRSGGEVLYWEHPGVREKYGELFERTREERERNMKGMEEEGLGEVERRMGRVGIW